MGGRSQPRKEVSVQVRIFGTDGESRVFSENSSTVNVSRNGVELSGVQPVLALGDMIGLAYCKNRAHFRVKWVGESERSNAGYMGMLNITPEKPLWDFSLPADAIDNYQRQIPTRRTNLRYRCQNAIEIHVWEGASFGGRVSDLSVGGCYVEIPIPVALGKRLKIGIWFGDKKTRLDARVTHSTPGVGVGIKFTDVSEASLDQIRRFLETLSPLARKPMRSENGFS